MSTGTRSQSAISGGQIVTLVGLTTAQVATLDGFEIKTLSNIAALDKEEFNQVLGTDKRTFMVRRRLSQVLSFLRNRGRITSSTTMAQILQQASSGQPATAVALSSTANQY